MPSFQDAPVTFVLLMVYIAAAAWTGIGDPSIQSLVDHGVVVGLLVPDEPWRLLSAGFLHGGLLHLAMNSMSLVWIGPGVERALGGTRFALLYLITAVAGNVAAIFVLSPLSPLMGGSGALFGMLGAVIAMFMRTGRSHFEFLSYHGPRNLVLMTGAYLVIGAMIPQISNAAHIGGLIAGFVLTYMFYVRGRSGSDVVTNVIRAGWIALLAVGVMYTVRPTLTVEWSVRQAIHGATLEVREDHDRRLRRAGTSLADEEAWMREQLPRVWGESGRRVVRNLFD